MESRVGKDAWMVLKWGRQAACDRSLEAQWQLYSAQWWQPVRVRACTARKVHAAAAKSPLPFEPTDGQATDCKTISRLHVVTLLIVETKSTAINMPSVALHDQFMGRTSGTAPLCRRCRRCYCSNRQCAPCQLAPSHSSGPSLSQGQLNVVTSRYNCNMQSHRQGWLFWHGLKPV